MFSRKAIIGCIFATIAASSSAASPQLVGTLSLDLLGYVNNDGTFKWQVHNTNQIVYTYCMSTNNFIGPNPQQYNVWSITGCSATDIDNSGLIVPNTMPGLNSTKFLEAAAFAETLGGPWGIGGVWDANNAAIHTMESNGDISYDGGDVSNFLYLSTANADGGGQPQAMVTPEPGTMALAFGAVSLLSRRRRKNA